jgi:hypothetical protein
LNRIFRAKDSRGTPFWRDWENGGRNMRKKHAEETGRRNRQKKQAEETGRRNRQKKQVEEGKSR